MVSHGNRVTSHDEQHGCLGTRASGGPSKSCLEQRRAARLRQIPPDSPKRQLPAQASPTLGKSPSPLGSPRYNGMCCELSNMTVIRNADCKVTESMNIRDAQTTLVDCNMEISSPQPKCCRWAELHPVWGLHAQVWIRPLCSKWPMSPSGSKTAFSVLLCSQHLKRRESSF